MDETTETVETVEPGPTETPETTEVPEVTEEEPEKYDGGDIPQTDAPGEFLGETDEPAAEEAGV